MTTAQKDRLYRRAYTRMDQQLSGGPDMFGWWDWRTLHYVSPRWYHTLRRILAIVPDDAHVQTS